VNWFQERQYEDFSQTLLVERELYRGATAFQEARVFENPTFGRVFALDGIVQLTARDSHIYHEMIAHAPLMAHVAAKRVLIVGGGDGGVLHEVLKHKTVEHVTLVELDAEVVDLSRRFFPDVSGLAFDDPRCNLVFGDGAKFVVTAEPAQFDIVIVDSTDPIGPGEALYSDAFYTRCRRLLRPGGSITLQAGAAFFQTEQLTALQTRLAGIFGAARSYLAPVPTYAAGMLALVTAAASEAQLLPALSLLERRFEEAEAPTRFYSPAVHHAAATMAAAIPHAGCRMLHQDAEQKSAAGR
jgi:spermidine synthase